MAESSKTSATKGEAAPAVIKATKPLEKDTRQPEDNDSETKVDLTKQKIDVFISEMKEMMEGFADRFQRLESKVDSLATKADQAILILAKGKKVPAYNGEVSSMDTSSDEEVTVTKKPNAAAKIVSFKAMTNNSFPSFNSDNGQTLAVRGFDYSLDVDYIKTALTNHFGKFGEITRVFVPTDRFTGACLGYAYVDQKEGADKALRLGGVINMGGRNLNVDRAEPIRSPSTWPFQGRCGNQGFCATC